MRVPIVSGDSSPSPLSQDVIRNLARRCAPMRPIQEIPHAESLARRRPAPRSRRADSKRRPPRWIPRWGGGQRTTCLSHSARRSSRCRRLVARTVGLRAEILCTFDRMQRSACAGRRPRSPLRRFPLRVFASSRETGLRIRIAAESQRAQSPSQRKTRIRGGRPGAEAVCRVQASNPDSRGGAEGAEPSRSGRGHEALRWDAGTCQKWTCQQLCLRGVIQFLASVKRSPKMFANCAVAAHTEWPTGPRPHARTATLSSCLSPRPSGFDA